MEREILSVFSDTSLSIGTMGRVARGSCRVTGGAALVAAAALSLASTKRRQMSASMMLMSASALPRLRRAWMRSAAAWLRRERAAFFSAFMLPGWPPRRRFAGCWLRVGGVVEKPGARPGSAITQNLGISKGLAPGPVIRSADSLRVVPDPRRWLRPIRCADSLVVAPGLLGASVTMRCTDSAMVDGRRGPTSGSMRKRNKRSSFSRLVSVSGSCCGGSVE